MLGNSASFGTVVGGCCRRGATGRVALAASRGSPFTALHEAWPPSRARLPGHIRLRAGARSARAASTVPLKEVLEAAGEQKLAGEPELEGDLRTASAGLRQAIKGQQGTLWFANIYPTKAFRLDFRQELTHHNHETLIPKLLPAGVEVIRMVPREREGGAFVTFRAPPSFVLQVLRNLAANDGETTVASPRFVQKGTEDILSKVCDGISQYLKNHPVRAFLCPHAVRAHRVRGSPYLEDFRARYPASRVIVRVEPKGAVSEEQIYQRLRHYGQLDDLEVLPEGKGFVAAFVYSAGAVAARNCLHRARIRFPMDEGTDAAGKLASEEGVLLRIEYEPFLQKWLLDTLKTNYRFFVPFAVFAMLGTTYVIWDPIRTFSVQMRVADALLSQPNGANQDLVIGSAVGRTPSAPSGAWGLLLQAAAFSSKSWTRLKAFGGTRGDGRGLMLDYCAHREAEVAELRDWLSQPQDQVMLFTGHRGNGQSSLVRQVVRGRAVILDVGEILEEGGAIDDQIFLRSFCRALGYWPAQGMDRLMNALLDLLMPGGSGKISRESEVLVSVQRVLSCVTQALLAWRRRTGEHGGDLAPLIVVDGFTSENKDRRDGFFDALVTWAAYVSEAHLARVVFIADSSFAEPAILAALRDRPERLSVQQLSDVGSADVPRILRRHFELEGAAEPPVFDEKDLIAVGGRFRDLLALVAHVKEGQTPKDAVRRLVDGAELTVRTLLSSGQPRAKWTRPQLWRAIRLLASKEADEGGVPYDVFLWSVFRGDEAALRSMKESNLIDVSAVPAVEASDSNRPGPRRHRVSAGSPLFGEAYRRLVRLDGLAAVFDLEVVKEDIKRESATVEAYEALLVRLQEVDDVRRDKGRDLKDPNEALYKRKEQLLGLILEQHTKLEKYHEARKAAQAALSRSSDAFRGVKAPQSGENTAGTASAEAAAGVPLSAPTTGRRWWSLGALGLV